MAKKQTEYLRIINDAGTVMEVTPDDFDTRWEQNGYWEMGDDEPIPPQTTYPDDFPDTITGGHADGHRAELLDHDAGGHILRLTPPE